MAEETPPLTPDPTLAPAWHSTLDPALVGNLQLKGWDVLDAGAASAQLAKSYFEIEKLVGVPADQVLKLPKDAADEAGWKAVRQRIGAPADPKDYSFEGIDLGDETASFVDTLRAVAAKNGTPKVDVEETAKAVHKWISDREAAAATARTASITEARTQLEREWGTGVDFEARRLVAEEAINKIGALMGGGDKIDAAVAALREVFGENPFVAKMFHTIGVGMGEDKFVQGGGARTGAITYEIAMARRAEKLADNGYTKRWLDGGAAEGREMMDLNRIIAAHEEAIGR